MRRSIKAARIEKKTNKNKSAELQQRYKFKCRQKIVLIIITDIDSCWLLYSFTFEYRHNHHRSPSPPISVQRKIINKKQSKQKRRRRRRRAMLKYFKIFVLFTCFIVQLLCASPIDFGFFTRKKPEKFNMKLYIIPKLSYFVILFVPSGVNVSIVRLFFVNRSNDLTILCVQILIIYFF